MTLIEKAKEIFNKYKISIDAPGNIYDVLYTETAIQAMIEFHNEMMKEEILRDMNVYAQLDTYGGIGFVPVSIVEEAINRLDKTAISFRDMWFKEQLPKMLQIAAVNEKKVAIEFFYWWYNAPGNNTRQGFEDYIRLNPDQSINNQEQEILKELGI
jgi:hypothetical protein